MKKELSVFLCAATTLFLSSCADMDVTTEERLDLPDGFNWREYVDINRDVAMSQIILNITGGVAADTYLRSTASNCATLLSDNDFASDIYLKYASCPNPGWFKNSKCPGIYANRDDYNIVTGNNTTCSIGGCWSGGWDELSDKDKECDDYDWSGDKPWCEGDATDRPRTLVSFLQDSLKRYPTAAASPSQFGRILPVIKMMCLFIPKPDVGNREAVKQYLKSYYSLDGNTIVYGNRFDSTLVSQHYHVVGRYDGKPYKYCEPGSINAGSKEKANTLDGVVFRGGRDYDYGKYTFCLNKSDDKIYVVK